MIQVSVKRNGQLTNQASFPTMEEAQAWLSHHEGMKSFGEPAQTIQQQVELSPAVMEMQEMHIPGSYEVEVLDISAELAQQAINAEAQAFLASTDWMVIRAAERGEELSPEFKAERQAARDRIVK